MHSRLQMGSFSKNEPNFRGVFEGEYENWSEKWDKNGRLGQPSLPLMGTGVFSVASSFRILVMRLTG